MKLRDQYGNFVHGIPAVSNYTAHVGGVVKSKDSKIDALEQKVNETMLSAIRSLNPVQQDKFLQPSNKIRMVSYEEAIKELANSLKPTDDKA